MVETDNVSINLLRIVDIIVFSHGNIKVFVLVLVFVASIGDVRPHVFSKTKQTTVSEGACTLISMSVSK